MKRLLKKIAGFGGGYRSKNQSELGYFFASCSFVLHLGLDEIFHPR